MQGNKHNYSGVSLAPGWNALAALSAFGLNDNKIGMNNIGGNSSSSVISSSSIGSVSSSSSSSRRQASIVKEKQELPWPFLCANGVVEFNARHFDSFAFEPEVRDNYEVNMLETILVCCARCRKRKKRCG